MFQNVAEIFRLFTSALVQWILYAQRLPKDFSPTRILVVKLDHIGDVLLATPVFSNLRQAYPNTELHALCGKWSRVILDNHPDVDETIEYNSPVFCRSEVPTSLKQTGQLLKNLRHQNYDLLIELRGDWRIIWFSFLKVSPRRLCRASLQVTKKLGFQKFSSRHDSSRNLDILKQAGIPTPILNTMFSISAENEEWASKLLEEHEIERELPIITMHPGSPISIKRWQPERFAELADWLIVKKRAQILFVGVPDEIPIITQIQELMQNMSVSLAGKTTIPKLASILKNSSMFIGNDSGPMHLAAAVNIPTIGIYGPGDPKRFGPIGEKCHTIQKKPDCPPCKGDICKFGEEGCMAKIQTIDVIETVEKVGYIG